MATPLCFVMMWIHEEMRDTYDSIQKVVTELGYECTRADETHGEITAKVKDLIRESRALVADLRGSRPNVYYEVGYAHALGLEVILTAPQGQPIEFDLAGMAVLFYVDYYDLREKLRRAMLNVFGEAQPPPPTSRAVPTLMAPAATGHSGTIKEISAAIEAAPDQANLHATRALLLQAEGRYEDAAQDFIRAIELAPGDPAAYLEYAYLLNGQRRFEESLEVTAQALQTQPDNTKALCMRAYALNGMRRYEEARAVARSALALDPGNMTARRLLETAESCNTFEQREEHEASPVEEMLTRAYALNNARQYEAALAVYDEVLGLDGESVQGHLGRGFTLNNLSRSEEALVAYDRAIEFAPDYANAYTGRGFTLNALRRFSEAAQAAKKALDIEPGNRAALKILSIAMQHGAQLP